MPADSKGLSEGWTTPAAVNLSPVTRDYPSRALNGPFQVVALRLFYQGTGWMVGNPTQFVKSLFSTSFTPSKSVNNLGAKSFTGYSHGGISQ